MTYIISLDKDKKLNLENISMPPAKKEILKKVVGNKILLSELKNITQAEFFSDFIEECEKLGVEEIYSFFR